MTEFHDFCFVLFVFFFVCFLFVRPKQMNAYTTRMCEELAQALARYLRDDTLRALILTGEGRAFCTGGDVSGADDAHGALMQSQLSHAREMRDGMHRVILA